MYLNNYEASKLNVHQNEIFGLVFEINASIGYVEQNKKNCLVFSPQKT